MAQGKENFILWFKYLSDEHAVFDKIPTEETIRSYQEELEGDYYEVELTDELFENGQLTQDGMQQLLDCAGDLIRNELAVSSNLVVSEILECRVIPNPSGQDEWYNDADGEWDNSMEYDPDEISLEIDDYDESEYKAHAVFHMHEVHHMFAIQLDSIDDFDPSKVVVRNGHESGGEFDAYYDGELLNYFGMGRSDEEYDYAEEIEIVKYEQ